MIKLISNILTNRKRNLLTRNCANPKISKRYNLCLCCIIKDENDYIEEWIRYHLKTGVEHFYVYDNDSRVPIADTINNLKLSEYTTITKISGKSKQVTAYKHCLKKFGGKCQWIGFIDTDEFIVAKTTRGNLQNFLKDHQLYGGIGINWMVFGSSGHKERSSLPQKERFTRRAEENFHVNRHIKNIVQPKYVKTVLGAHQFIFVKGKFAVNENFVQIEGSFSDVSVHKIQLNHYYCRSLEEYQKKIDRGYGDTRKKRTIDEFYNHDKDANKVHDTTILELFNHNQI